MMDTVVTKYGNGDASNRIMMIVRPAGGAAQQEEEDRGRMHMQG
jgi:hypothetical protein